MREISTTTCVYLRRGNARALRDLNEVIEFLNKVGYCVMDLSLFYNDRDNYILGGDDWEKKIDDLGETASRLGVQFYQCHLPFVSGCSTLLDPNFKKPGYAEYFDECMRRAYVAAVKLGVKWAVSHPRTYKEYGFEEKASREANHAYYDKYVEIGLKGGVGTAYENMLPCMKREMNFRYCEHYDQLLDLVDSYGDPMIGVCWDTGHANQAGLDQARALRAVGKRLKCLHINDNEYGFKDEHLLPYMGTVDWQAVISTLAEIGYEGSLNYETQKVTAHADGDVQKTLVKMIYENALLIQKMFDEEVQRVAGQAE